MNPGRKPLTGIPRTKPVSSVFSEDELRALDEWRRQQPDMPSRSEAVRRFVMAGLEAIERKGKGRKG